MRHHRWGGLVGESVDPRDVYFYKQTPTNANDNTTLLAVASVGVYRQG